MMIKVKNHQTPPTMRPDRDLQPKGKRCQKHRHQLQKTVGRGRGPAPAHQQSCQAFLHPSLLSAGCENPNVRVSCAFSFLTVDKDLWGCHPSWVRLPCRYIFTLTLTHTYTSRHETHANKDTDMSTLARKNHKHV